MPVNDHIVLAIGIAASTCTAGYLIPQLIKIYKEKTGDNVSPIMMGLILMGSVLWIIYGVMKKDAIIIAANCTTFSLNMATNILSFWYKKKSNQSAR